MKHIPYISSFNLTVRLWKNVQITSSKPYINSYAYILTEPTFGAKNNDF